MKTHTVKVDTTGTKRWYFNGKLHREDGPAIEWADGDKEWYINGNRHREDGPAIEWRDGQREWCINGELHREDGPAVESADGSKYWYINGKKLTQKQFNQRINKNLILSVKVIEIDGVKYEVKRVN
jgi:hypothetical protein